MKRIFVLSFVVASASAFAGINESFNYADGPLTTVSGGAWSLWTGGSGNSNVAGGTASIDQTTDVIREFGNELQTVGAMVDYCFDVKINTANTPGNEYYFFWSPASSPYTTGQNYGESLGFVIDFGTGAGGTANVYTWPNAGANIFLVGTITTGAFHTISGTMTKGASAISYTAKINNGAPIGGSFNHTDPRGINAIEFYQGGAAGTAGNFFVDNICMTPVPEPATMAALGLGLAAMIRRKRKS